MMPATSLMLKAAEY
jgi:hypothetical protein